MITWIVKHIGLGFLLLLLGLPVQQDLILQSTSLEPEMASDAAIKIVPPLLQNDLDLDNTPDCLVLEDGKAVIQGSSCGSPEEALWQSPKSWNITHAAIGDLNQNGIPEAVLLVWRPFKPWPVDRFLVHPGRIDTHQNSDGESCHIILIEYVPDSGQFEEGWAGSALARPLNDFRVADLDGDSLQELVVLETRYDAVARVSESLSVWEWSGFGFQLVTRKTGRFSKLQTGLSVDGNSVLLITGKLMDEHE